MNYPIDTAEFIADLIAECGFEGEVIGIFRDIFIPAVNNAYRAGEAVASDWPVDPSAALAKCERICGPVEPVTRELLLVLGDMMNAAYAQGQRDAKEAQS